MKNFKKEIIILFLIIIIIPSAKAEIIFNEQFNEVYNVEDFLKVNFSIEKKLISSDFVQSNLECQNTNEEILVYKKHHNIKNKTYFNFDFPLTVEGDCNLKVEYDQEVVNSKTFTITDNIIIDYKLNDKSFFPSEKIVVNGSAIKENGQPLDGIITISIPEILNKTIEVSKGSFFFSEEIKKDSAPKTHPLFLEAFEKNNQEKIVNYGKKSDNIEIKQKPTYIEISMKDTVKPPDNITIETLLLDQVKNPLKNETIIIRLFNSERDLLFEKSSISSQKIYHSLDSNAVRGSWEIVAFYGNIHSSLPFYVEENKELDIEITDERGSHLLIKNKGNIDYEGVIDIFIKNSTYEYYMPLNIDLGIGENKEYPLDLEGNYNLSVDGKIFQNHYLTGAAILPELTIGNSTYILFFIFLFILLLYLTIKNKNYLFKRIKTKKKITPSKKVSYIVFFQFDKPFRELGKVVESQGFSLNKFNDNLVFILFHSDSEKKSELKLIELSKKIKEIANSKGIKISIAIHSNLYVNKASFLKNLAYIAKSILNHSDGTILVSENIFGKLGVENKMPDDIVKINEKDIKLYECG